jgi:flagellin
MARINTNVASMISQHNLARSNENLQVRLQRLSTGLRINRGADGPAALIISERLRSEKEGIGQAINNAQRASNVIATAEAALAEVAALLTSIKSLVVESANSGGLSREEIEANQLQVDDAVASITRIANTTSFAGLKLLNGALDYITSGLNASHIADARIYQANFGVGSSMPISVEVVNSAEKASLMLSTGTLTLTSSVTLEVTGNAGVETLQFVSGTALSAVSFAVNRVSDSTGVTAAIVSGAGAGLSALQFVSDGFGSDSFVSVRQLGTNATFFETYNAGGSAVERDTGVDVMALVNGTLALGEGTNVKLNSNTLNIELQLQNSFAQQTATTTSFDITGGGAVFQLGPEVKTSQQISFGVQSVAATRLGDTTSGFLSSVVSGGTNSLVADRSREAGEIIEKAITQVSVIRGRLGAFERNTLQTNVRSLQNALENVTSSESQIRDADFATETAELTRAQLLVNVGTTVLSQTNQAAASVLQLLQ